MGQLQVRGIGPQGVGGLGIRGSSDALNLGSSRNQERDSNQAPANRMVETSSRNQIILETIVCRERNLQRGHVQVGWGGGTFVCQADLERKEGKTK